MIPKIILLLISVALLSSSCNRANRTKENEDPAVAALSKDDILKLNDFLKKHEAPTQRFNVSINKRTVVTGYKGTRISINSNDLITEKGKPLSANIDVELKELVDQENLITANAQTVSDGKLLISGGAYFIGMNSKGEPLKLKAGARLSVQFPKLTGKEMSLFYGQKNDLGQINWHKTSETLKPAKASNQEKNSSTSATSDVNLILDYIDSEYNITEGEKKRIIKEGKDASIANNLYDAIGISKLGWINCDRFLEAEERTQLYVTVDSKESAQCVNIYLVFKDINSVVSTSCNASKGAEFESMPVGYKVRLIAYTVKDEKAFAFSTDLTISKNQKVTVTLKETKEKDFEKLLNPTI